MAGKCFILCAMPLVLHLNLVTGHNAAAFIVQSTKFLSRKFVVDAVAVADVVVERRRRQRATQSLLAPRRCEVGLAECRDT